VKPVHHLLLSLPLGAGAVVLILIGDSHLTQRDWGVGVVVFGLGLVFTFFCVRELRRAGRLR
jgi:hypothetical protein